MTDEKISVRNLSEVPDLTTEKKAREFWDTREVTEEYLESAGPVAEEDLPPTRPRTGRATPIAGRLDQVVLNPQKQFAVH
ncbi:hypothetical protein BH23ACT11_BH23ACT11_22510 [soil metagenome]